MPRSVKNFLLFVFTAVVFLMPLASQGGDKVDNPFKNAKVGDYASYKMTTSVMGKDIEVTMKQTVTAIDDKRRRVTLKTQCLNGDKVVIDGEAVVLVPRRQAAA